MASSECHLAQGRELCSKSALACGDQSLFPNYQHLRSIQNSRMCHEARTPWETAPLVGQPEGTVALVPELDSLLCDRACKLTAQPENLASSFRACCRPCKSVVVVVHGVPSRAEGDIGELWMGLKEGLRCGRTLLLSRMVEKRAWEFQQGSGPAK